MAEDVIIVTSSLTQDINSKDADIAQFRGNAIRALSVVIDGSMLAAVERFFKQAIVEREHCVASAALVSAVHLWDGQESVGSREVVRRWLAEAQQALNAAGGKSLVQYHALGLLALLKSGDRVGLLKLAQQIGRGTSNPLAICLFLRLYGQLLASDPAACAVPMDLKPFLRQAGPRGEMVGLEAARIVCSRAGDVYAQDLEYTIGALQSMLGSSRHIVRFGALRVLNELSARWPGHVASCNSDIEALVTHPNRHLATLAITALLKTGDEASVGRLVRQIRGYVGDISDDFRVVVVDAVRALGLKFPNQHAGLLDFLGSVLREEGARAYKQACVDAICELMEAIPAAREPALLHLCEFIEDSEYAGLTVQILHLLGTMGPSTKQPSKLVRYIYNRLVLEDAPVRVAAIGALAKFYQAGEGDAAILSILGRSLSDPDDDVRDRTRLALAQIESESKPPMAEAELLVPDLDALEASLQACIANCDKFVLADLPSRPFSEVFGAAKRARLEQIVPSAVASPKHSVEAVVDDEPMGEKSLPEWATTAYGPLFKTSAPVALTDSGAEYTVVVRKHVFPAHLLLEFVCRNTVPGVLLSDVSVAVNCNEDSEIALGTLETRSIASLQAEQSSSCFVLLAHQGQAGAASLNCILTFRMHECDPSTGAPLDKGFEDRYQLDDLAVVFSDWTRHGQSITDWTMAWEALPAERIENFALGTIPTVPEAISALLELYGVRPLSGPIDPSAPYHTLLMAGELLGVGSFMLRVRMAGIRGGAGVKLELAARSHASQASDALLSALG